MTKHDDGRKFYIQRHASGFVGDSPLWWKEGGHGYTTQLDDAQVWTEEDAMALLMEDQGEKFTAWPKPHVEAAVVEIVDYHLLHIDRAVSYLDAKVAAEKKRREAESDNTRKS